MVESYRSSGQLPRLKAALEADNLQFFTSTPGKTITEILQNFLPSPAQQEPDDKKLKSYIAIHAYLPLDEQLDLLLQKIAGYFSQEISAGVTVGYGPRFLHSTGQLHKGDSGKGLFIQLSADIDRDVPIPDRAGKDQSSISFGILITSQYLGDYQALQENGRQVLRIHLGKNQ